MTRYRRAESNANWLLLAALLAVLALVGAAPLRAQSVASLPAKPADYVSDFAHVLSPETVAQLDSICDQLDHTKANAQMAIVTVNSLEGDDPADYADALETKWKMGKKGSDRGVLVLLAVKDHKYRIEDGYGLEGILNDAKVGDIGRSMVPYLRAGDYNNAMMLAVGQLAEVIATDAGVTLDLRGSLPARQPVEQQRQGGFGLGGFLLLLLVLIFFGGFSIVRILLGAGLFFGGWGGRWGGPWMGGGMGGGGWGSGGGGFGGGGGGGFGGFGGGSFGGGGAGGSW